MVPGAMEIEIMYKNLNIGAAASALIVGAATVARVRVQDGAIQMRFTTRTNLSNLPKGEQLRNVGVKGSGRRVGLPSELADLLVTGDQFVLVPGKYGWNTVAPMTDGATASGRVSA